MVHRDFRYFYSGTTYISAIPEVVQTRRSIFRPGHGLPPTVFIGTSVIRLPEAPIIPSLPTQLIHTASREPTTYTFLCGITTSVSILPHEPSLFIRVLCRCWVRIGRSVPARLSPSTPEPARVAPTFGARSRRAQLWATPKPLPPRLPGCMKWPLPVHGNAPAGIRFNWR